MGNKKRKEKDRRSFLSFLFTGKDNSEIKNEKTEMVKMLTAEGKLVEISKAALEEATKKKKATNKEIYNWMKNPSKENP